MADGHIIKEDRAEHGDVIDIVVETVDPRAEIIRTGLSKSDRIIEIGPSHAPIAPKSQGWKTTIVDHAPREELVKKYSNETALINRVEEVDFIWREGDIADVIPSELHGTFDAILASHVGEHMPDFIRFLQAADKLLSKTGIISLALPDKRYCFDFFQPHTTTGDMLAAYAQKRVRHERKTFFNQAAYQVHDGPNVGWNVGSKPQLHFASNLIGALAAFNDAPVGVESEYKDSHASYFTPASFKLLILELRYLGLIPWTVDVKRAPGVEFYAVLTRSSTTEANIDEVRMDLLKQIVFEKQEEIDLISEEIIPDRIEKQSEEISAESFHEKVGEISQEISTETFLEKSPGKSTEISLGKLLDNSPNLEQRTLTVSAIIPVYNGSRDIEEAIYSVLDQTIPVKELILVNDGSTDNSLEILQRIKAENSDKNIQIISKENGGQSSARNLGVQHSTGDLIAFLDQDDMWYSHHIEKLIEPFYGKSTRRLGWVYSNLDEIDERGSMVTRSFLSGIGTTHPKNDIFTCLREDMFILPSASLISRSAFEKVGGFDERLSGYEDDDLFLRMFQAGFHNIFIDEALSKWRIHTESASYSYRMARSRIIYMHKLFVMFPDDVKRSRYYRRDLLVPRFKPHLIVEYLNAVRAQDQEAINVAIEQLRFITAQTNAKQGRAMRLLFVVSKHPKLIKFAYTVRRPFRRALLRRLT